MKSRITADTRPFPGNSLQRFPSLPPEIQNHCRLIVATIENGFAYSSRSRNGAASDSILLRRKVEQFRLQQSRGAQAGTGRHEGGIILSKKPPEWHLPRRYIKPPHRAATTNCVRFQFSSSQSRIARLLLCRGRREERPACCFMVLAGENSPPAALSLPQGRTARLQNDRCGCRRGQVATKAA